MSELTEDLEQAPIIQGERKAAVRERSPAGIADANRRMVARQASFRRAADAAARALIPFKEVLAVTLFGSVAMPLWKEIPRTGTYHRTRIAVWHECPGIDLAVWPERFNRLSDMQIAIARALNLMRDPGHKVLFEVFSVAMFEPGTDRFVGHLCHYKKCPADKRACAVPGCGAVGHLQQFRDFRFDHAALDPERSLRLFDRATGAVRRAADLPPPAEAEQSDNH